MSMQTVAADAYSEPKVSAGQASIMSKVKVNQSNCRVALLKRLMDCQKEQYSEICRSRSGHAFFHQLQHCQKASMGTLNCCGSNSMNRTCQLLQVLIRPCQQTHLFFSKGTNMAILSRHGKHIHATMLPAAAVLQQ